MLFMTHKLSESAESRRISSKVERSRKIRTRIVALLMTAGIVLILVMLAILLSGENPPSIGSLTSALLLLGSWLAVTAMLWIALPWSPCVATLLCLVTVVFGVTSQSQINTWNNLLLQDLGILAFPIGLLALGACLWQQRVDRNLKRANRGSE